MNNKIKIINYTPTIKYHTYSDKNLVKDNIWICRYVKNI